MATDSPTLDAGTFLDNLLALHYREVLMTFATAVVVLGAVALYPGSGRVTAGFSGDVTTTTLAFVFAVAVVAGAVKGAVGFGYALIATPVLSSVIDPVVAVVVLAIPPWMINVFQVGETNTGLTYVRREWPLVVLAAVGTVVGVTFLSRYQAGPLVPMLIALLILAYVAFQVVQNFVVVEEAHHPVALGGVGLATGFLLGAANLGPLLPAYLHTFERDRERYVGGVSMVFAVVFTIKIVQTAAVGLLTPYLLWLGCAISVVTLVGLFLGTYLRRVGVDERWFNRAVVALLLVIGLNILRNTVPAVVGGL
ncbi:TSUP family transporter [Halomarina ordinaria]|uniref:Probable membrane transporter protein n=1 Tax=Halomarina ordinaria TaxID=3033939 RepID=A0ABD5UAN4_9EURY|nr:TSUP family transporter [Halomarina sp. PSRA2]